MTPSTPTQRERAHGDQEPPRRAAETLARAAADLHAHTPPRGRAYAAAREHAHA